MGLGAAEGTEEEMALEGLESLLDARIHGAKNGAVSDAPLERFSRTPTAKQSPNNVPLYELTEEADADVQAIARYTVSTWESSRHDVTKRCWKNT
jgi:hypothetical protein